MGRLIGLSMGRFIGLSVGWIIIFLIQQIVAKNDIQLKNDGLLIKMYKTTNLQIIKLYTSYIIKKIYY